MSNAYAFEPYDVLEVRYADRPEEGWMSFSTIRTKDEAIISARCVREGRWWSGAGYVTAEFRIVRSTYTDPCLVVYERNT